MSLESKSTPQDRSSLPNTQIKSELAERIERFQEAAQDLLDMHEPAGPGNETVAHISSDSNGETRCYYLSAGTVQHEQELLKRYHAQDFCGLLEEMHMLLVGLVKIMKTTPHNIRVKGYVIASLGCLLEQASALALRMRNVYDKLERVGQ